MWYASQSGTMLGPLAQALHERAGIRTVLVCLEKKRILNAARNGLEGPAIERIVEVDSFLRARPSTEVPDDLGSMASAFEARHGISLVEVIRSDRHLGIDFVTGARAPRSWMAHHLAYAQIVDMALRLCEFYEQLIRETQPLAVMVYPGMMASAALADVAAAHGIPIRGLAKGRKAANQFHWTIDKFARWWGIDDAFAKRLPVTPVPAADAKDASSRMGAPFRMQLVFDGLAKDASPRALVRSLDGLARKHIINRVRGMSYGHYLARDELRLVWDLWRWKRSLLREAPVAATLPAEMPFVFFPLQTEPESNLMAESPMCDNQLTFLDWLCKASPAGWYVVVKEHPGLTVPRPAGFWDRIRAYRNVIVAAGRDSAEAIADRARLVAVINGTLGHQAAIAGRPVLTFHPYFQGRCMSHVLHADSYETTKAELQRVRDNALPSLDERRRAGQAYLAALDDCAFTLDDEALIRGAVGKAPISGKDAGVIAQTFLDSIAHPAAAPARTV